MSSTVDGPKGVGYTRRVSLLDVAADWSFWQAAPRPSIPRSVPLPADLRDSLALVVQGVRRCGKSTLLTQLVERYALDPQRCAFLNFEDPRLSGALDHPTLDRLVAEFRARHPRGPRYYFLDEIQGVPGWQRWLRTQLDRPRGDHFVVSGSNAQLLSGELGSALVGRHLTVELYPFDLDEFRAARPGASVADWLHFGGFPEPLAIADGDRLRRQYFNDIVERDVRERLSARSSAALRQVAQMVYESAGSELSLRRVAGACGVAVDTAASWIDACENAYLLFGCPYFAFSERKRASRNRKFYPVDSGLRRVVVTRTGADTGKALECATFLALRRRFGSVSYWRDEGEVDFVVQDGSRVIPVQVSEAGPLERHHRALTAFYEQFPQAEEAVFVTVETLVEELRRIGGENI